MATKLINQIGCEGYANIADINNKTSFFGGTVSVAAYSILGIPNEKWLTFSSRSSYIDLDFTPTTQSDGSQEIEVHWVMIPTNINNDSDVSPMTVTGFDQPLGVGFDNGFFVQTFTSGSGTLVNGPAQQSEKALVNQLYFCVFKIKSETAVAAGDGTAELWINNKLHSTVTNLTTGLIANPDEGKIRWRAPPTSASSFLFRARNLVAYDGLTAPIGTKPDLLNVIDLGIDTVTGTDYELVGNAATKELALTDTSTSTYIQTLIEDALVSLKFDIDVSFAQTDIVGVVLNVATSRVTVAPNNNTVLEVLNGTNVIQSDTIAITALGTARQKYAITNLPTTPTKVGDLELTIKNGNE